MELSPLKTEFLIIGAGLSGLHLAQLLRKTGKSTLLLEKSRGLGGRIATRRIEDLGFDHGTHVIPRNITTLRLLNRYALEDQMIDTPDGILIRGGMTKLAKAMADSLIVQKQTRALGIRSLETGWEVTTDVGIAYQANNLILATPLEQARDLLSSLRSQHESLPAVSYSKKVMSLNVLSEELIEEIADRALPGFLLQAPRGLHPTGVIFDGNDEFSEKYFEESDELILDRLHEQAEAAFGRSIPFRVRELKKWRYSRPLNSIPKPFVESAPGLFVIGDAFLSGSITGAISSAEELASHLT